MKNVVIRSDIGLESDLFVIGAVGRFHPVKNFDFLLACFARFVKKHTHARLVLVGCGSEEMRLRKKALDLGISEVVLFIVGKQAKVYYPLFNCFVQTSEKEGISLALLEAMSFSLPCVVRSAQKYHPVITHKKNGLVVYENIDYAFVYALEIVFKNKIMGNEIGTQAYQTVVSRFDQIKMINRYAEIFNNSGKKRNFE